MKPVTFLIAFLGLAACDAQVETRKSAIPAEQAAPAPAAPLAAAGPAATLQPDTDPNQQWAAMNGLYTHVAFLDSPAEGWRVFRIGDVLGYRLLSEAPGRVDLELTESTMDEASGDIGSRVRRVIVGWSVATDGSVPATVTVTPAR
jgi:hypothetical protein